MHAAVPEGELMHFFVGLFVCFDDGSGKGAAISLKKEREKERKRETGNWCPVMCATECVSVVCV